MGTGSLMSTAWHYNALGLKYGTAFAYAVPIVIWGAGSLEGTARSVGNAVKTALWGLALQREWAGNSWQQAKGDFKVAMGCGLMTGLSVLPIVGTYHGYSRIFKESMKYSRIRAAMEKSEDRAKQAATQTLCNDLSQMNLDNADTFLDRALQIDDAPEVKREHFTKQELALRKSLVHYYYLYTGAYLTFEKSCKGVEIALRKTAEVARRIFKMQIVKKALKKTWQATKASLRITWNTYVDELNRVVDLTSGDRYVTPEPKIEMYWES